MQPVQTDWIELAGVIVALVVGIISIVISVNTLKLNSKMIEGSTRPYIVIYFETLSIKGNINYIVIKNFGKTGAKITTFDYPDYVKNVQGEGKFLFDEFADINGMFIAPGQSILLRIFEFPDDWHTLNFHIEYSAGSKTYKENYAIKVDRTPQYTRIRPDASKNSMEIIAEAAEEICEKTL